MALMQCPECGKTVSCYADTCPHCGYPLKVTGRPLLSMPGITFFFLAVIVIGACCLLLWLYLHDSISFGLFSFLWIILFAVFLMCSLIVNAK